MQSIFMKIKRKFQNVCKMYVDMEETDVSFFTVDDSRSNHPLGAM